MRYELLLQEILNLTPPEHVDLQNLQQALVKIKQV